MPRTIYAYPNDCTMADLLERLGGIEPRRIRMKPAPGTAKERDVTRIEQRENRLFELVEGTLVEKIMGFVEGYLAMELGGIIRSFVKEHDLGIVAGADAMVRLMRGLVRIPDISFIRWGQLPSRKVPSEPIPDLAPDLAVEVLSEGNTTGEMQRKLKEYFLAGVRVVWFVDPRTRTAEVFTVPDQSSLIPQNGSLDGGDVLPGFLLPLKTLFADLTPAEEKKPRRRKK